MVKTLYSILHRSLDLTYEILKNDTSVVILDKDNDIAALIKEVNNELKIAKSGYSNTYTINAEEKKLTIEITNLFEED